MEAITSGSLLLAKVDKARPCGPRLRDAANEHLAMLDRTPERVMAYFQDRRVRYAA